MTNPVTSGQSIRLRDIMHKNDLDWQLQIGYSLELTHGLMGYFPAVFTGTRRIVLTLDKTLLGEVWKMLPPRRSKVVPGLVYASEARGHAFSIQNYSSLEEVLDKSPIRLLTRDEFSRCTAEDEKPFSWALGLVSDDMSQEEFVATLEAALAQE